MGVNVSPLPPEPRAFLERSPVYCSSTPASSRLRSSLTRDERLRGCAARARHCSWPWLSYSSFRTLRQQPVSGATSLADQLLNRAAVGTWAESRTLAAAKAAALSLNERVGLTVGEQTPALSGNTT